VNSRRATEGAKYRIASLGGTEDEELTLTSEYFKEIPENLFIIVIAIITIG
jgi:hypothetical protein